MSLFVDNPILNPIGDSIFAKAVLVHFARLRPPKLVCAVTQTLFVLHIPQCTRIRNYVPCFNPISIFKRSKENFIVYAYIAVAWTRISQLNICAGVASLASSTVPGHFERLSELNEWGVSLNIMENYAILHDCLQFSSKVTNKFLCPCLDTGFKINIPNWRSCLKVQHINMYALIELNVS